MAGPFFLDFRRMIRRHLGQGRADMIALPATNGSPAQSSSNGGNGLPGHFLTVFLIARRVFIPRFWCCQKIKQLAKPRYLRYFSYYAAFLDAKLLSP